jgi:methionine synthase II (cobalamin-independent)
MSFHADTVGSYLRPKYLLEARDQNLPPEQLFEIENKAIKEHVQKQVSVGLKIVSDGEFRRDNYIVDFAAGLKGVLAISPFDERMKKQANPGFLSERGSERHYFVTFPYVDGKIASNPNHPEYAGFEYFKSVTPAGIIPKVIIPSPLFLTIMRQDDDPYPKQAYTNVDDFYKDISQAYRETILHFYELGARVCINCNCNFFVFFSVHS